MKQCLFVIVLFSSLKLAAQENLLVYSVKGEVTSSYQDKETTVKVGTVLLPGSTLKVKKQASLTMLCKRGKPLTVTSEGTYPLTNWKDSCKYAKNSLTANYFSYIWNEFYTYSPEYREAMRKRNELAVTRGMEGNRKKKKETGKLEIDFSKGMDTVCYAGRDFPLSWTNFEYNGKYVFRLFDIKGVRLLYADSSRDNFRMISKLKEVIEPSKYYLWTVSAPNAGFIKKRVLHYINQQEIDEYINAINQEVSFVENDAGRYFRMAYLLELKHYLADALVYYQKAAAADPSITLYSDKLIRFRNEYWIR